MRNVIGGLLLGFAGVVTAAEVDLSLNSMDATLSKVAVHAQRYPPTFSSPSERQEIEHILKGAIIILDAAVAQYPTEPDLWFRDGYANAMGHNLDFPGCDRQFYKAFKRFLELRPNDKKGNYYFGAFLAGTAARQKECVPYLKKAIDLGVTDAHYALAFYYLTKKDKQNALYHLKQYAKANPGDKSVQAEIKKIVDADIKIHRNEPPPTR